MSGKIFRIAEKLMINVSSPPLYCCLHRHIIQPPIRQMIRAYGIYEINQETASLLDEEVGQINISMVFMI
jgi:hypothetical protein